MSKIITTTSFEKSLNNYVISFEGVWENKELKQLFYQFLKKEYATESFDFIEEVEKLSKINDKEQIVKEVHRIITTFIQENSQREVNLPSQLRKKVLVEYKSSKQDQTQKEWKIEVSPTSFFQGCSDSLIYTLKQDSFKRFIRTPEFTTMIQKYIGNTDLMVPKISKEFVYQDKDFEKGVVITDKDFDFIKMLLQDSFAWEIIGSKDENGSRLTTYWSDVNYLPHFSASKKHSITNVKYECILNVPFHKALTLYSLGSFMETDENTNYIDTTEYIKKDGKKYQRDHYVSKSSIVFPFPFDQRVYHCIVSTDYDPKRKRVIEFLKPCADPSLGPYLEARMEPIIAKKGTTDYVNKKVYNMYNMMAIVMEKVDDYRTYYTQINLVGIGGWNDVKFLSKLISHDRGLKLRRNIERKLKEVPDDITFEELMKKYPNDSMLKQIESCEGLVDEFLKKEKKNDK